MTMSSRPIGIAASPDDEQALLGRGGRRTDAEPSELRLELVDPIAAAHRMLVRSYRISCRRRAEVRAGQVPGDLLGPARRADLAVHHDGHLVGHAEDEPGELLHQQDRRCPWP